MNERITTCIEGKAPNCVVPFFWQHGDSHSQLLKMIELMYSSGMDAFCVESRVHSEFCNEQWWDDFRFILKEAAARNMKVWLLDDKHFPSGYANDYIESHPELSRKIIREEHMDVSGPNKFATLLADRALEGERLLYVLAYHRYPENGRISDEVIDLTDKIEDGLVRFDVPEGFWRVVFIIQSNSIINAQDDTKYYVDMLSEESCNSMIKAVYEPHYEHFAEYFGNTFVGFFSDEPCFNNEKWTYYSKLGRNEKSLPWNEKLVDMMAQRLSLSHEETVKLLPSLWFDETCRQSDVRLAYMDVVSELYSRNFPQKIGNWCKEHNVLYIGHVIEDMGAHMRLGFGSGHFFRAQTGQDMSGIDVVLHQIVPGFNDITHSALIADGGVADPEFFDYTLPKLGASAAHIDPRKNGRFMCEIFGAYGWAEGLPMMKYLADIMLSSGVNMFVPHAFTNRYPNEDCPPHFWGGGTNPQFRYFGELVEYMNNCVAMLSGGIHQADVAVLYPAEADWCSNENVSAGRLAKSLIRNQIDFDFIPFDVLKKTDICDGRLLIAKESYNALLVPFASVWCEEVTETIKTLAKKGLTVIFEESAPEKELLGLALDAIPSFLRIKAFCTVSTESYSPNLRIYRVKINGIEHYMLFNDSIYDALDTVLNVPYSGGATLIDAWTKKVCGIECKNGQIELKIPAASTIFLVLEGYDSALRTEYGASEDLDLLFDIYISDFTGEERLLRENSPLFDITSLKELAYFSGNIRYKTELMLDKDASAIDLGTVGETAELYINGEYCGLRIQAPYIFDIKSRLKKGKNTIEILTANNPAYRERDRFSRNLVLPPSGILGKIRLFL